MRASGTRLTLIFARRTVRLLPAGLPASGGTADAVCFSAQIFLLAIDPLNFHWFPKAD
jgi:hypothetical protein